MNLRELLKALQAVDEKHLDMHVMVSPASGHEYVRPCPSLYLRAPAFPTLGGCPCLEFLVTSGARALPSSALDTANSFALTASGVILEMWL